MKFATTVVIFFSSLIFSTQALSQDYSWHAPLSLSLSFSYAQIREHNRNPNSFSGFGPGFSIERRIEGDRFYHFIEVSAYGIEGQSQKTVKTKALIGTGSMKYSILLANTFGSQNIHIGLFGQISIKDDFFKNEGHYGAYWANFWGFGGTACISQPITDRLALEILFEIPIVGVAYRPSIQRRGDKNTVGNLIKYNTLSGNFALPGKYLNPSLQLSLLSANSTLLKGISYKYSHYEVKTSSSNLYWENTHSLMFSFGLKNSIRG